MKTRLRKVQRGELHYNALMFVCPGCALSGQSGLHMLAVNFGGVNSSYTPAWDWDGKFNTPTLTPSILTRGSENSICHSYLTAGVFNFLSDCTHSLAGKTMAIPDLHDWMERMK